MARKMYAATLSDRLPLRGWDEDEWVQFQRPNRLTEEQIAKVQASAEILFNELAGTRLVRNRPSIAEQESEMVANCLVGCSVEFGEKGGQIFKPGENCGIAGKPVGPELRTAFYETWYGVHPELAEAIIGELREWHPPFNLWGAPPPSLPESEMTSTDDSEPTLSSSKPGDSSTTSGSESTE